jgi:hypothetical protein
MHCQKLPVILSALLISSSIFSAPKQLNSYEEIKNKLLSGSDVKAIIDLNKDCSIADVDGTAYSPNIFSITLNPFIINYHTKAIIASINMLNANTKGSPFKQAGYSIGEIKIQPDNSIIVDTYAVGVPDYKNMLSSKSTCFMSREKYTAGVKFFAM